MCFIGSQGSVVAKIELVFNPKFIATDNETTLAAAVRSGKVGSLDVDKESFTVVGKYYIVLVFRQSSDTCP